jgi:prevent-host-death family protein
MTAYGARHAQSETVGIRELKQNPSEVIARAAAGTRFEVLSNGKPVGVVIQRDAAVRRRWVSTEILAALSGTGMAVVAADSTGWAEDLRAEKELTHDPIVDPWGAASQDSPASDVSADDRYPSAGRDAS